MGKKKKEQKQKTAEEIISQGNSAEDFLQSPIFSEAYENLEDKYINAWISSSADDEKKREQCYVSLKVLSEIRLELESMINSGKIAKQNN
jgi:hypothetical protein|tara:strand:+ start:2347 stop:2616 length:270 start_codon:yes stop_codon:yes gene_type:complete